MVRAREQRERRPRGFPGACATYTLVPVKHKDPEGFAAAKMARLGWVPVLKGHKLMPVGTSGKYAMVRLWAIPPAHENEEVAS